MSSLERALALILAAHAQTIEVSFHDLETGERIELRARESVHAASTMKLAVLLAAYRLGLPLDQPVRVENRFASIADGSTFAVDPKDDERSEERRVGKEWRTRGGAEQCKKENDIVRTLNITRDR